MKFKFGLEPLLKHRKQLENLAQREYFLAQEKVNEALRDIERMYEEINEARREIVRAQHSPAESHERGEFLEAFINGTHQRIHLRREEARQLMMEAEEKHNALLERAKDFKVIEKLKERQKLKHKKMAKRKELKEIDDVVTMTHKGARR